MRERDRVRENDEFCDFLTRAARLKAVAKVETVCVCVRERARQCVCERERKREKQCVCEAEIHRDSVCV